MKTEIESKELLKQYGIATTRPMLARSAQEAATLASGLAAPLAVKVVSADIVHKVAAGGVKLNIGAQDAACAYDEIMDACRSSRPDAVIDGVLLEEMIAGELEIFVGARVDPDYGSVVLLGLGGSNVEQKKALPVAALAPIDERQAGRLIDAVFGGDTGTALGVHAKKTLVGYLMAVAGPEGMLARGDVSELDINPIIVHGERCVAVDAVADANGSEHAPGLRSSEQLKSMIAARRARLHGMKALFDPKAIAFIGASTATNKLGYRNIKNLLDFGFKGDLYPIHLKATEIAGVHAYPSILDVPGPVDRAYIAVAAAHVPAMLIDCAKKGVQVVQVLTAGFTEWSGEDETRGKALDNDMRRALADTPMRMVGPNCIGTFSASSRIAMGAARYCPEQPDGIAFISQSGTFAGDVVRRAQVLGTPVARVLSCGNCSDLDLVDYLLFCEEDLHTTLTAFYIESIQNPGLFFRIAERARKPIVLFKGGTTEQGIAAAGSHTAALATDKTLWEAAIRQAGVLQVDTLDDLMDIFLMHSAHGELRGNRLGIFGSGGGVSVTASDTAMREGMVVPKLSPATSEVLRRFGVPGTSVANPIDIPVWSLRDGGRPILGDIVDLLKQDPQIDSVIVYVEMGSVMDFSNDEVAGLRELEELCASVTSAARTGPRVSLVLRSTGDKTQEDFVRDQRVALIAQGVSVFNSTTRAVRAHAKLWTLSSQRR